MSSKRYIITCKECGSEREIGIMPGAVGDIIDWLDNSPDADMVRIISGRQRLDGEWGWQCMCGNNDLLSKQETETIKDKTRPHPREIAQIVEHIKVQPNKFEMVEK